MIQNRITHLLTFDRNKNTTNDSLASSVVLNLTGNQRDTTNDSLANSVILNISCDNPDSGYFFSDDCGNIITRSNQITATVNGKKCIKFTGTTSLSIPHSPEFNFGFDNFTIEFWIYLEVSPTSNAYVFSKANTGTQGSWASFIGTDRSFNFVVGNYNNTSWQTTIQSSPLNLNTWTHISVVRNNTALSVYLDGSLSKQSQINHPVYATNHVLSIGSLSTSGMTGYLSDIRITKKARYTSAFTPDNQIQRLTPKGRLIYDDVQGNVFSPTNTDYFLTKGPYSNPCMYFDGSSIVTFPQNLDYNFLDGASPFTLEFWVNVERNSTSYGGIKDSCVISFGLPTSGTIVNSFSIYLTGTSTSGHLYVVFEIQETSSFWKQSRYNAPIATNVWTHLAITRESNTSFLKLYVNGIQAQVIHDSVKSGVMNYAINDSRLGTTGYSGWERYLKGYLSDVRLTRECRYFGNFNPLSVLISKDEYRHETVLLLHFDKNLKDPTSPLAFYNIKKYDVSNTGPVNVYGDTLVTGNVPFNQGLSAYFDGNGDYVTYAYSSRI